MTSSDGCGEQHKNRWLHHWVSMQRSSGKRQRVWCHKAPAHGKDACDPAGGRVEGIVNRENAAAKAGVVFSINSVEGTKVHVSRTRKGACRSCRPGGRWHGRTPPRAVCRAVGQSRDPHHLGVASRTEVAGGGSGHNDKLESCLHVFRGPAARRGPKRSTPGLAATVASAI